MGSILGGEDRGPVIEPNLIGDLKKKGIDVTRNAFTIRGASSLDAPKDLEPGEDFTYGVRSHPMEKSTDNALKAEISRLMTGEAYVQGGHPFHRAAVESVRVLMHRLHKEDE